MFNTIVVGSDGSSTARRAVEAAGDLALVHDAEVVVVFGVGSEVASAGAAMIAVPTPVAGTLRETLEGALDEQAQPLRDRGVRVRTELREGSGAEAVLDVAEEANADLIVVGNRGMGGKRRFLLGSVPNSISHHAPCSVLIVRTDP